MRILSMLFLATLVVPRAEALPRVTLVAGEYMKEPFAVTFDGSGNTYIVEMAGNRVRVLSPDGAFRVLAGTGEKGFAGDGGPAEKAQFNGPHHLLMGPDGHLYVADTWNNCIRRIDLKTGVITRFAGTGEKGFSGDGGKATAATFGGLYAIAFHENALYTADLDNRRIRAIDLATGIVRTVAGNGEKGVPKDGEPALTQPLVDPRAVAVDAQGNVYICERAGHALRVVDGKGLIRTVAGTGQAGFSGDGGPARTAALNGPKHISVDADGTVLITDTENHVIRRYSPPDGTMRRVAGTGEKAGGGLGSAPEACPLNRPHGAQPHPRTGEIYISDSDNHRVLRIEK